MAGVWPAATGGVAHATAGQSTQVTSLRADFNDDGADDLAVGAPGESVGSIRFAGAVNVLYGSTGKLTGSGSQIFTQDTPGVGGSAEPGDSFGAVLVAGDPGPSTASATPSASGSTAQRTASKT